MARHAPDSVEIEGQNEKFGTESCEPSRILTENRNNFTANDSRSLENHFPERIVAN